MIKPLVVQDTNLSRAWAQAFLELTSVGGTERHPAMITINGLEKTTDIECPKIRTRLDDELGRHGVSLCATVAGTLFPKSLWNPQLPNDSESLYSRYAKAWPFIAKCPANRRGVYFRRLTAFAPSNSAETINQLKFIIDNYHGGNHRKSAMQASILDPTRDHTSNKQKGFPCLQQVSFTPLPNDCLSITGFYATQYQFEKAYGNYLGLYWLGQFMAKQLQLKLSQVVCFAAFLRLGDESKSALKSLETDLRLLLKE